MSSKEFDIQTETLFKTCVKTLLVKGREYALGEDRLESFKKAAILQGVSPSSALFGMLAKHIVSLSEMCAPSGVGFPKEKWLEKIQDSINYLALLWALVNDTGSEKELADEKH